MPDAAEAILERFDAHHRETKSLFAKSDADTKASFGKTDKAIEGLGDRLTDVEQKMARRGGGGSMPETKSWGQAFVESDDFKRVFGARVTSGCRAAIEVKGIETKTITSASGSAGGLVARDQRFADPVMLPRKRLPIRALLQPGTTSSNTVYYVRQTVRTNSAAPVAEGNLKPQSDLIFAQDQAPVRTIAHFMVVSTQIMDDAPGLQSMIDGELRYGLEDQVETQLLFGDGSGENIKGMIPQATPYDPAQTFAIPGETPADRLLLALAQAEKALLPASGIILNTIDWYRMLAIKDGVGRYLSNGPFSGTQPRYLWDLPVAATMNMPQGKFLVGSFEANCQIFDRMDVQVLLSTEDSDNFRKNLCTVRGEERFAFTVKRPQSLIYGDLPVAAAS